jgi:hypothetical protein
MRDTEGQKHTKRFRKRGTEIDTIGSKGVEGYREKERERGQAER